MTSQNPTALPGYIDTEPALEELLSRPSASLVQFMQTLSSPLIVLGAGGKMGPTLAMMARRAAGLARHPLEVIAVSRFSDTRARLSLEQQGVKTVCCDLLDTGSLQRLPEADNVIYLVGLKFGTAKSPATTWAMNTIVPAAVADRYRTSRLVALSTGNVYPLTDVERGGSVESDPLTPLGEYANAAVGRERIFEFYSRRHHTPVALVRLYYAVELRYGVIVDLARKVHAGEPIDLANGYFNCIWQGDANDLILRALSLAGSPPSVWNLCRPEIYSVRSVTSRLGELLARAPRFSGSESATAFLGNATRLCAALGPPPTPLDPILAWTAHWVKQGGRDLGRPTHFEVRDGKY
jgi:nucleoside-diphosphate-sugar epimerase